MLDENLPTFQFKQQPDNPFSSPVYFTRNGSEPAPEYVFERAHPSTNPAAANKYAVALRDPYSKDVVYAEVVVAPEWSQPTLSAAEVRAQQGQSNGARLQPAPVIPDNFTIQLYDPDQTVIVRYYPGGLTKTDSWEFEMLSQSFKMPTPSQLDRQNGEPQADFRPRNMFKWKRDSRLTKDMTCFNVGKSLGKHKSKEPDITVALYKMGRESAVTVYEPNLQRVEMEDRKGLDIVLVLGAEVIRDLYLAPEKRADLFNTGSGAPVAMANGKRKNSRPTPPPNGPSPPVPGALGRAPTAGPPTAMSGALGPTNATTMSTANVASSSRPNGSSIDPETLRLMKQMKKEDEEQLKRQARERKRREEEERRHVDMMLKQEESEKRRRQAEVDRETERLRQLYGVQGQEFAPPSNNYRPPGQRHNSNPPMPAQHQAYGAPPRPQPQSQPTFGAPPRPQRPTSVGPGSAGPFNSSTLTSLFRPSGNGGSSSRPYGNAQASVSTFFQNVLDPKKVTKKKSVQW